MSLSDCLKCWDTPCTCGHEYKDWKLDRKVELASVVLGIPKAEIYSLCLSYFKEKKMSKVSQVTKKQMHDLFYTAAAPGPFVFETVPYDEWIKFLRRHSPNFKLQVGKVDPEFTKELNRLAQVALTDPLLAD